MGMRWKRKSGLKSVQLEKHFPTNMPLHVFHLSALCTLPVHEIIENWELENEKLSSWNLFHRFQLMSFCIIQKWKPASKLNSSDGKSLFLAFYSRFSSVRLRLDSIRRRLKNVEKWGTKLIYPQGHQRASSWKQMKQTWLRVMIMLSFYNSASTVASNNDSCQTFQSLCAHNQIRMKQKKSDVNGCFDLLRNHCLFLLSLSITLVWVLFKLAND